MKAIIKGKVVEVWIIDENAVNQPDWVRDAFSKNIMQWVDHKLKVLMPALNSNWAKDSQYYGYGIYTIAKIGDVIDLTNCKVVSLKQFEKNYQLIE